MPEVLRGIEDEISVFMDKRYNLKRTLRGCRLCEAVHVRFKGFCASAKRYGALAGGGGRYMVLWTYTLLFADD